MTPKPIWSVEKTLRVYQACQTLFSSELGAEVLEHLEEEFSARTSFCPGATDATAYHEGERSVMLMIRHRLATDLGDLAETLRARQAGYQIKKEWTDE